MAQKFLQLVQREVGANRHKIWERVQDVVYRIQSGTLVDPVKQAKSLLNYLYDYPNLLEASSQVLAQGVVIRLSQHYSSTNIAYIDVPGRPAQPVARFGMADVEYTVRELSSRRPTAKAWNFLACCAMDENNISAAICSLEGGDAQYMLHFMAQLLDDGEEWKRFASASQASHWPFADPKLQRRRLIRLLRKLAQVVERFPPSFYLTGVRLTTLGGTGGYSIVHRGTYMGRTVAVKQLTISGTRPVDNSEKRKMFYREAVTWWSLRHQRILRLEGLDKEIFARDTNPYASSVCMISEWQENGDILRHTNHLESISSPNIPIRKWMLQIAEGVEYLHSQDVIHGDLRPDNVLIDAHGDVLLSDFGLSVFQTIANSSFTGSRGGNPHYFPPELIEMNPKEYSSAPPKVRKPSDIYAFACFCVEYYSGDQPWAPYLDEHEVHFTRIRETIDEIVLEGLRPRRPLNPAFRRTMSDSLWYLVSDCWHQDPDNRPPAWELRHSIAYAVDF